MYINYNTADHSNNQLMNKNSLAIRSCSTFMIIVIVLVLYFRPHQESLNNLHRQIRSVNNKNSNATNESRDGYKQIKVWVASIFSVFIISIVGLLGVAVIPFVQKVFFSKVIQFLVALAVGTLTGDAFLHLLPHAFLGGHSEGKVETENNNEFIAVMKGLVALTGVFLFFFAEKSLSMVYDYRAEIKAEEEEKQRQVKDPRLSDIRRMSALLITSVGNRRDSAMYRRLSKVTSNGMEEDNILTTGLSSRAMKSIDNLIRFADIEVDPQTALLQSNGRGLLTVTDVDEPLFVPMNVLTTTFKDHSLDETAEEDTSHIPKVAVNDDERKPSIESNKVQTRGRKGGKNHGHSHEMPGSIAAVAWMVILGDGLHNFTDGLAIGVAFADNFSGGISTAFAVFCHELPHELGDFAVLLKTGMKVKQALFYNVVSSVLCFVGMFIGIALHNIESATSWIFAVTAGTFIYIALVDMMPELNSVDVKLGDSRILHLLFQAVGLVTGVGIMLLIAVYEDRIKAMLG